MTITKADLADHLVDAIGLPRRETMQIVEAFLEGMKEALVADSELKLSNFGAFTVKEKAARPGRNPRDGQPYEIKARRVVTFHASPLLRAKCNPELPLSLWIRRAKKT
jgi:integration host factor subunit alpha